MIEQKPLEAGSKFDLEHRKGFLWASEAPRMMNLYPSAVALWAEKTGQAEPADLSGVEAVQMGHVMQPVVLDLLKRRTGIVAKDTGDEWSASTEHPFLAAHTDGTVDSSTLVEAKAFSAYRRREFGEWGSDEVAPSVYVQCIHEALCWNADRVIVPVLFGGQEFQVYEVQVSAEEKRAYAARAGEFWQFVQKKVAPAPKSEADILMLYPRSKEGRTKTAPAHIQAAVEKLREVKASISDLEQTERTLAETIKVYMEDAGSLFDSHMHMLVSWKTTSDTRAFDLAAFKKDHAELLAKYTKTKPGQRRFLLK